MKRRIITGLILGAILIPVVVVPQLLTVFEVLVIFFCGIASFEILNMFDKEKALSLPVKILCTVLTIGLYLSVVNSCDIHQTTLVSEFLNFVGFKLDMFLTVSLILLVIMSCMIFVKNFDAGDAGRCFVEIFYVGITFGSFSVLRTYGVRFIVYLLTITILTDVFALVFGLNFGKHKMAPTISPKKSWEGAIGGTAVALIVGFLFLFFYQNMSPAFHDGQTVNFFDGIFDYNTFTKPGLIIFMIVLTLSMSVCSQVGDLVASKLKRTYGIKDFSNIFPGHGGILDRFDSALFTSAIFLFFLQIQSVLYSFIQGVL